MIAARDRAFRLGNPAVRGRDQQRWTERPGARCGDDADQQRQHDRILREGRGRARNRQHQRSADHDAPGTVTVADRAGDRLRHAPHQLPHRERQADAGIADAGLRVQRADEQRLRLPDAERQAEHGARGERDREATAGLNRSFHSPVSVTYGDDGGGSIGRHPECNQRDIVTRAHLRRRVPHPPHGTTTSRRVPARTGPPTLPAPSDEGQAKAQAKQPVAGPRPVEVEGGRSEHLRVLRGTGGRTGRERWPPQAPARRAARVASAAAAQVAAPGARDLAGADRHAHERPRRHCRWRSRWGSSRNSSRCADAVAGERGGAEWRDQPGEDQYRRHRLGRRDAGERAPAFRMSRSSSRAQRRRAQPTAGPAVGLDPG